MTARLAQAAREARYLLQVYGAFSKPIPLSMVERVNGELVEALEEWDAANSERKNSVKAEIPELGKLDRFTGSYMTLGEEMGQ